MNQSSQPRKVIVITSASSFALGNFFIKAIQRNGHNVVGFDLFEKRLKYVRGGIIGKKINEFWPVETWIRKANRELVVFIQNFRPNHIIISGDNPILIGTLAFARSILEDLKITLFWPDTLANLTKDITHLSPLIDQVASYSETAIKQFELMGFKECFWLPFAGDIEFLGGTPENLFKDNFKFDCSFIGGWRPERETVIETIISAVPNVSLQIVGPLWSKRVRNKGLIKYIDDKPKFGTEFGNFIRSTKINLNIIDDTNFPAANMRFFEIPSAGGLQLSSSCPELKDIFLEGESIFYFESAEEAVNKVRYILSHPKHADLVRRKSYALVRDQHNYERRMEFIS